MNTITQHYIVDLSSNNNFVQVPAMQGDGNEFRFVTIELIENGKPYVVDQDDCYITIAGTKPDGKEIWNICEMTPEGYIKVEITYQMTTVPGRSIYSIAIFSNSKNNQLKSFPFYLLVTAASYDPGYIISTDEFQALAQFTDAAVKAAEAAEKSAQDAALAGSIGIMNINRNTGHLIFEKVDSWRGNFHIEASKNLIVNWE